MRPVPPAAASRAEGPELVSGQSGAGERETHDSRLRAVDASRIAWLTTVAICVITAVILLFSGYLGYFGVLLAIALSAAINLLR